MGKLPQISKASKSNVILLKQEGYKNVEISKRLKLSEASVSRMLQRNKQNLSLSPLKRSGRPRTTTPRTDCKIKLLCQKQPFISSSEIKRSMQELISVTTRTIRNRMHKDFKLPARKPLKKTPDYTKNGPAKAWILLPLQRLDKRRLAESDVSGQIHHLTVCFLKNYSFADHMDLHQRTHGTSNQPLSTRHRSWCGGAFPAKAEVVFISRQKDKQWMPHGILAS